MPLAPHPDTLNARYRQAVNPEQPPPKGGIMRRLFSAIKRLKVLFLGALVLAVYLSVTAASSGTGQATALGIASVVAMVAPFILRYIALDGRAMLILTGVVALVISVVAGLVSGELRLDALGASDPSQLLLLLGWTFGVTQAVFSYFKDHPLGPLAVK